MGLKWTIVLFVACISLCMAYGSEEEDYKRALRVFRLLKERRGECANDAEECDAVITKCCGELVCHWEDGYSMTKKGNCVTCAPQYENCQRDEQCCQDDGDMYCDRGANALQINGICNKYRRSGSCYKDSQCVNDCVKKWYQVIGECS